MVFQEPMTALNPLMSIGDQVAETVRLHRAVPAAEARRLAREALDLVGTAGANRGRWIDSPTNFPEASASGWLLPWPRCLRPALLIADEPTTALDAGTQAQVLRLLRELAHTHNMGVILVTHDLAVVAAGDGSNGTDAPGRNRRARRDAGAAAPICSIPMAERCWPPPNWQPKRGAPQKDAAAPVLQVRRHRSRVSAPAALAVARGRAPAGGGRGVPERSVRGNRGFGGRVRLRQVELAARDSRVGTAAGRRGALPPATERRRKVAEVLEQVGLSVSDARRLRLAYLFVSHDLFVRSIADRIYVMRLAADRGAGTDRRSLRHAAARLHPGADCSRSQADVDPRGRALRCVYCFRYCGFKRM